MWVQEILAGVGCLVCRTGPTLYFCSFVKTMDEKKRSFMNKRVFLNPRFTFVRCVKCGCLYANSVRRTDPRERLRKLTWVCQITSLLWNDVQPGLCSYI